MRIITLVGRQGTIVCSDSQTNTYITRQEDLGSSIGELKLLKEVLSKLILDDSNKNKDIRIILSNKLRGLCNASTVNHWLITKTSKRGVKLTTEYLGLVSDIVSLSYEFKHIKFVSGSNIYYGELSSCSKRTWNVLESLCPRVNVNASIESKIVEGA